LKGKRGILKRIFSFLEKDVFLGDLGSLDGTFILQDGMIEINL
jgi:hypothetical protein